MPMTIPLRRLLISIILGMTSVIHASEVAPNMLLLDAAQTPDCLIVVGERGTILRSNDSGNTWERSESGILSTLTAVSFADDGFHGWAAGHDATILATTDGGMTWQTVYQGDNQEDSFLDIRVIDQTTIIAIGAYGYYVESRDRGHTWQSRFIQEADSHLNRLTSGSDGTLYVAGERGTLLFSTDHGQNWEAFEAPYGGSFYGILPLTNGHLLAHGLRGQIYLSSNQGNDWSQIGIQSHPLLSVSGQLSDDSIILAGQPRFFLISHDGGESFEPWATLLTTGVADIIQGSDGRIWALGEAGLTLLPTP